MGNVKWETCKKIMGGSHRFDETVSGIRNLKAFHVCYSWPSQVVKRLWKAATDLVRTSQTFGI